MMMHRSNAQRATMRTMQVRSGLGHLASEIMSWTIFTFIFGSCVAYIIIVGDTFSAVMRDYVVEPLGWPTALASRQAAILAPAFAVMLPISLQRSMVALAPASTLALAVMMFTTGTRLQPVACSMSPVACHSTARVGPTTPDTCCVSHARQRVCLPLA
jgi:hypothetical protein